MGLFHKSLNERLATYSTEIEKLGVVPKDWFWGRGKLRKLDALNKRVIEDLRFYHSVNPEKGNDYERVQAVIPLLKELEKDVQLMLKEHRSAADIQEREAKAANFLLKEIAQILQSFQAEVKKNTARANKVALAIDQLTQYLRIAVPEAAARYELLPRRIEMKEGAEKGYCRPFNAYPLYEIYVQPKGEPDKALLWTEFGRESLDPVSLKNVFTDLSIIHLGESLISHIDEREQRHGFTGPDINSRFYDHIKELKELGFEPLLWEYYGSLGNHGMDRLGVRGDSNLQGEEVASLEVWKRLTPLHTYFFRELKTVYQKNANHPAVDKMRDSIRRLYDDLNAMLEAGRPYTTVQKTEAAFLQKFLGELRTFYAEETSSPAKAF